jgi:imidazole glycerol-phosphate synthase subunit HisH
MSVVIVDYGSGNLRSAAKAFERAVAETGRTDSVRVSCDPDAIARADHVVLPGVGAFADCRRGLDAVNGMLDAMREAVFVRGQPFLGICVGMQLLARIGHEHGDHPGLGWINGEVGLLPAAALGMKIPHMGWNDLEIQLPPHPVLHNMSSGAHAYFVHSFGFIPDDPATVAATVNYGEPVVAVIARDNLVGTQFHPEKSQATGLRLIGNFLRWRP